MKTKKIIAATLMAVFSTAASAATFNFTGNITYNTDVVTTTFTLDADANNVRVWTDSFQSGVNFDPITALWNASTGTLLGENDDNSAVNPSTQTYYDSGFTLATLAAGTYWFTVAAYPNFAAGTNISDGFAYDGMTPTAIADWCQPASNNCSNQKGTYWSVWLDGVSSASNPDDPSQVPEPASLALMALGLAGLAGIRRRKA